MKTNLKSFKFISALVVLLSVKWALEPLLSPQSYMAQEILIGTVWGRLPFLLFPAFGLWADFKRLKKQEQSALVPVRSKAAGAN